MDSLTNPFEYRKATGEQAAVMRSLNDNIVETYQALLLLVQPSDERTEAIRKLQEFRMWANTAILGIGL